MAGFNTAYLQTNRGIIKILQIVFGFVCCSLLCGNWYGGKACFYNDGRMGYVILVYFHLSKIAEPVGHSGAAHGARLLRDRGRAVHRGIWSAGLVPAPGQPLAGQSDRRNELALHVFFIGIQLVLFIWDYQILHGQAYN